MLDAVAYLPTVKGIVVGSLPIPSNDIIGALTKWLPFDITNIKHHPSHYYILFVFIHFIISLFLLTVT